MALSYTRISLLFMHYGLGRRLAFFERFLNFFATASSAPPSCTLTLFISSATPSTSPFAVPLASAASLSFIGLFDLTRFFFSSVDGGVGAPGTEDAPGMYR